MKQILFSVFTFLASVNTALAINNNTVEVKFNGTTATVTVANNISSYITNQSSGSHVKLVQSENFLGINRTPDNEDGEIIYVLSGTSTNGEFYLEGSFKCTVELNGLTLTNPSGPAINIQNGKRVSVSVKSGTTNTLTDGANDTYNGCFHCKGHTKFKGKGTLNVSSKSKHAVYSKEYIELKNLTLNITAAPKDGIHCKEYFLMESGTVTISNTGDDGIQCELDGEASTGEIADHEDEDTGNVYQLDGTLTIKDYSGKAIKADGGIYYRGGTQDFNTNDTSSTGIENIQSSKSNVQNNGAIYDLNGRRVSVPSHGIYIQSGKKVVK